MKNEKVAKKNEVLYKMIKTLLTIERMGSTDFMEEMECKRTYTNGRDNHFTQEEAKKMVKIIVDIYLLSHNIISSCCVNSYDELLEQTFNELVDSGYLGKHEVDNAVALYNMRQEDK